jgi:DNA polymerase-3 subunit delta
VRISADKLAARLGKELAPVWFVAGDDPLLVGEAVDLVRAEARRQGYDEREAHRADARFDWDALIRAQDNLSLFASRKIVEVRLPTGKPGKAGAAAIVALLDNLPPDTLFIIVAPRLDKATAAGKWAQALQKEAVWVDVKDIPPEHLSVWIGRRMRAAGLQYDADAVELMAMRVEGNLLAAQQEISKLTLLTDGQRVTVDIVRQSVADGARFDVFQLADAAVGQDAARAIRILYGLRNEGVAPTLTVWALVREINTLVAVWTRIDQGASPGSAMNDARVWRNRQPLFAKALRNHDESSVRRLLAKAAAADKIVKGARSGVPWNSLLELVILLARPARSRRAQPAGYAAL